MKQKSLAAGLCVLAALTLSGCSIFYPNAVPTKTATPTPTETKTATPTPTPTVDPSLKKVEINIIDSSAFMANGYVDVVAEALKVLEDDGKCTLTLTQGELVQKVTVGAVQNVSSTVCNDMHVPINTFKAADIQYTVTYQSSTSAGISKTGTVQIQ